MHHTRPARSFTIALLTAFTASLSAAESGRLTVLPPSPGERCDAFAAAANGAVIGPTACGVEFVLDAGAYSVWAERETFVSADVVGVEVRPQQRSSVEAGALVPAGRVSVAAAADGWEFLHVALEPGRPNPFRRPVLAGREFLAPLGRGVAIRRSRDGSIVEVSRPIVVAAGSPHQIAAAPPTSMHVLLEVDGPKDVLVTPKELRLGLTADGGTRRPPDLLTVRDAKLLAAWYEADVAPLRVELESVNFWMERQQLRPRASAVLHEKGSLQLKPSIEVRIQVAPSVPEALIPKEMSLDVARFSDGALMRTMNVAPGVHSVSALLPDTYKVSLRTPAFTIDRIADLADGESTSLVLDLAPFTVRGRIRRDTTPLSASVQFRQGSLKSDAKSDADGQYSVLLWEPGRYVVDVVATGIESAIPYSELLTVNRDSVVDIDLPGAVLTATVIDAKTKAPLKDTHVSVRNRWGKGRDAKSVMQTGTTADDGTLRLSTLRPGTVELRVTAKGYVSATRSDIVVGEDSVAQETIEMERQGEAAEFRVELSAPSTVPPLVAMFDAQGQQTWVGEADAAGVVRVPRKHAGSTLAVTHPDHAFALFPSWAPERDGVIRLAAAAPPLTVRVTRRDEPAIHAAIHVWTGNALLSGSMLAFATRAESIPGTGIFVVRRLPQAPVRILATAVATHPNVAAAMAVSVGYPWPGEVVVRVVE